MQNSDDDLYPQSPLEGSVIPINKEPSYSKRKLYDSINNIEKQQEENLLLAPVKKTEKKKKSISEFRCVTRFYSHAHGYCK
jgi:hypothetical protein